ncbi:MAG: metallophosphoesterase [Ruminiclostridium sp.]|nr:metallophosphoesterase [Ruminiclostridium sp.]
MVEIVLPEGILKHSFIKLGNIWLGFVAFYGVFLIIAQLFRAIFLRKKGKDRSAVACTIVFCAGILFSICVNAYGTFHAWNIVPEYYEVSADKGIGESVRVVFATDLHLGANSSPVAIRNMVERINEQDADIVVMVGDIFVNSYDSVKDPQVYIDELKQIRAKLGTYATYGNHDVSEDLICGFSISPAEEALRDERMTTFLEKSGFTILEDSTATFPGGITLVGRADLEKPGDIAANRKSAQELLQNCSKDGLIIVASHEPEEYQELAQAGADVVLSGHLHNGQIFPGNLFIRLMEENPYGYRELYGIHTFVSAGAGTYGPPLRIGTNSDIFVVDIDY